jgi:hypothetical protein
VEKRRHPAHPPVRERFNERVIIFLTVCSKDRKPLFARADSVAVIVDAWRRAEAWSVGRYVVMPDQLHPVLCSSCVSGRAADAMGPLLEKHRFEKLATDTRTADLATRFLGHAVAAFGKLRFEMAVRRGQPGPRGISTGGG